MQTLVLRLVSPIIVIVALISVGAAAAQAQIQTQTQDLSPWHYAGVDEANVRHICAWNDTLYATAENGRIFRSTNGTAWNEILNLKAYRPASAFYAGSGIIIADFETPAFSGDDFGGAHWLVYSTTSTVSWRRTQAINRSLSGKCIGVAATQDRVLFAGEQGINALTFNESRRDFTFVKTVTPLVTTSTLACITSRNSLVIAGGRDSTLYRSNDGGTTWQQLKTHIAPTSITIATNGSLVAASPNAIFRSLDTGKTWQMTGYALPNSPIQSIALAFGYLYAATSLGVIRSRDGGQTWYSASANFSTTPVHNIITNDSATFVEMRNRGEFYRFEKDIFTRLLLPNGRSPSVLAATQTALWASTDSLLWRSTNGHHWQHVYTVSSGGTVLAIAGQFQDREVLLSTTRGMFLSTNSAQSFVQIANSSSRNIAIVGDTIWGSACNSVIRSFDKGKTWTDLPLGAGYVGSCVAQLLTHGNIVYASGLYWGLSIGFGDNSPSTWNMPITAIDFEQARFGNPPSSRYYGPSLMASRRGEFLLAQGSSVSVNNQWLPPIIPSTPIATAVGANSRSIFLGTNSGLYVMHRSVPSVRAAQTLAEKPHESDDEVFASLFSAPASLAPSESLHVRVFPNPSAAGSVTVHCTLDQTVDRALDRTLGESLRLRLSICDVLGRELVQIADGTYSVGSHTFVWDASTFRAGVYLLKAQGGPSVVHKQITIVR